MAGTNPQLAIRIAANTEILKKNLAEGKAAIEALGPSVEKMAKDWAANGAKVIQNAHNITAALQGVNLSTLSAADASKNLRALDLALAQLKASGQPIPPLMQQTAEQIRALISPVVQVVPQVKSLSDQLKALDQTERGLSVSLARVNELTDQFGGKKAAQDAEAMAAAVQKIGGAAKLTESEQARVNRTVNEAIQKYEAMGQVAPKHLINLASATTRVVEPTRSLNEQLKALDQTERGLVVDLARVNELTNQFGGRKAAQDAEVMAAAVQKIGGATKLTEAEQAQVNRTVTDAITKYKQLGQTAPPHLVALQNETKKLDTHTVSLSDTVKKYAGIAGLAFGGAAVISGIKNLVANTFDYAENISDLSRKMAVSTEAAQRWQFAAQQSGASLEDVDSAVRKLSVGLDGGDASVRKALANSGLEFEKIRAMNPEEAFNVTVAAIEKIPNPMAQARVAVELFGKAGAELLPAIRNGFAETADSARVMSDDVIDDLDEAKDAWERFSHDVVTLSGQAVAAVYRWVEDEQLKTAFRLDPEGLTKAGNEAVAASLVGAIDRAKTGLRSDLIPAVMTAEEAEKAFLASGGKTTAAMKAEAEAALRLAEAFQKQVDVLTGKGLTREVAALSKEVAAAQKQGGLSAYEYKKLGERLEEMHTKGAVLPNDLHAIWLEHERLNQSIKVTTDAYKGLADVMKLTPGIKLGLAPPPLDVLPKVSPNFDPGSLIADVNRMLAGSGRKVNIPLGPPPDVVSFGQKLMASLTKSLEGLGGIIVGAIQGGGNVGRSVFASVGGGLGADLGGAITKGMTKTLADGSKAVAGSFAKMIGGLAGPLGALAGNLLGGALDKIFGKNQGREDAKAFAASFGGFDALRQKMLSLGAEGDRLWIQLTQNSKGPAQVAATIKAIEDAMAAAEKKTADMNEELATMRSRLAELKATSEPTFADMQSAAEKLGLDIMKLGPAMAQQQMTERATEIYNAFDTLRRGGADINAVIAGMAPKMNEFVQQSLAAGTEIPENFRAVLQAMIDNGTLIDANGDKLKDLSGIKFGEAVKSEWELIADEISKLTKSIEDLVRQLGGGVAEAARQAAQSIRDLPDQWELDLRVNARRVGGNNGDDDGTPGFAGGTHGRYLDFGAGTPVMLHGRERVMTENEGRYHVGGGLTINIHHPSVREDQDIDRITESIVDRLEQRRATG